MSSWPAQICGNLNRVCVFWQSVLTKLQSKITEEINLNFMMFSFLPPTTCQRVKQALASVQCAAWKRKKSTWKGTLDLLFPFVQLFHNQTKKFTDVICTMAAKRNDKRFHQNFKHICAWLTHPTVSVIGSFQLRASGRRQDSQKKQTHMTLA